jgi:hypothetical protein
MPRRPIHQVGSNASILQCQYLSHHGFSWVTPPLFAAVIVTALFLTRHSLPTNPGNVFKHIINWVPLFAHLTLLLIYSATGGMIV